MKRRAPVLAGGDVIVAIGGIVRVTGQSRSTAKRRMKRLLARDRAEGKPTDWFIEGEGERSPHRYNLTLLERAHPSLFRKDYVDREAFAELLERMDSYEAMIRDLTQRHNALAAAHRDTRRMLKTGST